VVRTVVRRPARSHARADPSLNLSRARRRTRRSQAPRGRRAGDRPPGPRSAAQARA
jgi:hypothetical protein